MRRNVQNHRNLSLGGPFQSWMDDTVARTVTDPACIPTPQELKQFATIASQGIALALFQMILRRRFIAIVPQTIPPLRWGSEWTRPIVLQFKYVYDFQSLASFTEKNVQPKDHARPAFETRRFVTTEKKSPKLKQFLIPFAVDRSDEESFTDRTAGSDEEEVTNRTIGSNDEDHVQARLVAANMETEKSEVQGLQVKVDRKCEFWKAERRQWEGEITRLTVERVRWEMKLCAADEIKASWDADQAAIQQNTSNV